MHSYSFKAGIFQHKKGYAFTIGYSEVWKKEGALLPKPLIFVQMSRDLARLYINIFYIIWKIKKLVKIDFLFQNLCFLIKCYETLHDCILACSTSFEIKIIQTCGLVLLTPALCSVARLLKLSIIGFSHKIVVSCWLNGSNETEF